MLAAFAERYGAPEVIVVRETNDPNRKPGELLIDIRATAVTAADARIRAARFPRGFGLPARLAFGLRKPRNRVLGSCFAGVVAEADDSSMVGKRVAGMTGMGMGAHAERISIPAKAAVEIPGDVSFDDAAGVLFGGTTALHYLRDRVGEGTTVLINGASGAVGTSAVQLAALAGADVTAVCSERNTNLVTSLGATRVHDYVRSPVTEIGHRFDYVLDTVGNLNRHSARTLLTEDGVAGLAVASLADTVVARGNVVTGSSSESPADFTHLLTLLSQGRLNPVIQQRHPLSAIRDAHALVDSGRKVGNVVVNLGA